MTQSNHQCATRRFNSSKRCGRMFFHLDEITLGGARYLTELTWRYGRGKVGVSSHYPVRHPGAQEADALAKAVQPDYRPPYRYNDMVVATAFLIDYATLPPGTSIYGGSPEQLRALQDYLGHVPWKNRSYTTRLRLVQDGYGAEDATKIMSMLAEVRQNVLGARTDG